MFVKESKNQEIDKEQETKEEVGESCEDAKESAQEENDNVNAEEKETASKEDELNQKLKETEEKLLRTYAEYDNFRKRTQKEKDTMFSDGQASVITEILGVIDNLERALSVPVESEDAKNLAKGVEMTLNQVKETLKKLHVTPIETDNQEFDPQKHNAVMHVEDENYGPNAIVEELMKGYQYKDKVLRHSMVKVAN